MSIGTLAIPSLPITGGRRPALDLNFLRGSLDPRITFTRASTATFVGSNGLIQSAAVNQPRFDYDPITLAAKGLLIEEQRTNLIPRSQEIDNAYWIKGANAAVTANAATAPDGTVTADQVLFNLDAATADFISANETTPAGATVTASIWAWSNTPGTLVTLFVRNNVGGTLVSLGLALTSTPKRFSLSAVNPTVATSIRLRTTAAGVGVPIFFWGAQLEAGAFATSYIPTTGSSVVRATELAVIPAAEFAIINSPLAASMVTEFSRNALDVGAGVSLITNAANQFRIGFSGGIGAPAQQRFDILDTAGSAQMQATLVNPIITGTVYKAGAAWETNNGAACINGGAVAVDVSITLPTSFGRIVLIEPTACGYIRKFMYYRQRLSNTALQALTIV